MIPALVAVSLAATIPFLQTVHGYFIGDDFGLIRVFSNQPTLHFLSLFWRSWDETVYGTIPDEIRPIIALSYQFDFFWGSGSQEAFHISNVTFHALNSVLVLLIARVAARLSFLGSVTAASFFAILPFQAETVSWISGRADSIPALFYLASFLTYVAWRRSGDRWLYLISVLVFFLALFSKQYAITMLVTLALYDIVVAGNFPRASWSSLRAYVPFLALTVGYLGLRYLLFQSFVREETLSIGRLPIRILSAQEQHLELLLFRALVVKDLPEGLQNLARGLLVLVLLPGVLPAAVEWRRAGRPRPGSSASVLAYFGPVWWLVSVAPLTVTYLSARHLYLAAAGLAVTLGLACDVLRRTHRPTWRRVGAAALLALLAVCASGLQTAVSEWTASARISSRMASDVEREASEIRPGSLLLLGAHARATIHDVGSPEATSALAPPPGQPWLWSFGMPYAVQPPFASAERSNRVAFVAPFEVSCCPPEEWLAQTWRSISVWRHQPDGPIIALVWDSSTGDMTRGSGADDPCLPALLVGGLDSGERPSLPEMNRRLAAIFERVEFGRSDACPAAAEWGAQSVGPE